MLIYVGNLHKKNGAISQLGAEKITFPLNLTDRQTDRQTDIQTYRNTDIQTYRHTDKQTDR